MTTISHALVEASIGNNDQALHVFYSGLGFHLVLCGGNGVHESGTSPSDLPTPQVAANTRGIQLVGELIREYGLGVVSAFMGHIQRNAEASVRHMLRQFSTRQVRGGS